MQEYKVIGGCRVAGVEPGGTVSQEALDEAGANIAALLGVHLEETSAASSPKTSKTAKAEAEKP